ncbi:MAG: xanthine dehydrogenase family protein molybdopterin-binding subunit [bacterium]
MAKTDCFKSVGKNIPKIDSLGLSTGEEKFTDDFCFPRQIYCKLVYSSSPFAKIINLDLSGAEKLSGVVEILSYKNTPSLFHTTAGQGFPEPSPYDTKLFDQTVRFVGDRIALIAAENPVIAELAARKIKIEYQEFTPVFNPQQSTSSPPLHFQGEHAVIPVPYLPEKNIAAKVGFEIGAVDSVLKNSDLVINKIYQTHYASHCALEPHSAISYFDSRGRLVIISSTQVPFHARRIVSQILDLPVKFIRVIKPRIGGGFGGKQEILLEPLVALITLRTKRPARLVLSREEVFISTRTRHPMEIELSVGADKQGSLTAISMKALMNTGAYGSHALTVLSNTGSKTLPLFNKIKNIRFHAQSVYTNLPVGGAYRGYGATQGYFALGQQIDILARELKVDVLEIYKQQHIKSGETSPVFEVLGEGKEGTSQNITSCQLTECIDQGAQKIDWYGKRDKRIKNGHWVRGVGMAAGMQGSGIPRVDLASAYIKINDDGSFNLNIGATDLGTGSDTILAQIAAETLHTDPSQLIVLSSDTDTTPFDVGAYASSTTYISGNAVRKCAEKIKTKLISAGAELLQVQPQQVSLENQAVVCRKDKRRCSYEEIARYSLYSENQHQIQATASNFSNQSPPPFIAQFAEVEINPFTGELKLLNFVSAVDCGQPINPLLVEGQVEGAVVNGISYALTEQYKFSSAGRMQNANFKYYHLFRTPDLCKIKTIIVNSYEQSGPFGAKSIGEIAINGPMPAIANAIFDAVGIRLYQSPFTPEKIYQAIHCCHKELTERRQ